LCVFTEQVLAEWSEKRDGLRLVMSQTDERMVHAYGVNTLDIACDFAPILTRATSMQTTISSSDSKRMSQWMEVI
jgi:hypothetical protein